MLNIPAIVTSLFLLSVAAIVLNIFGIVIIRTRKELKRKASSLFVINLLAIHLFQGIIVFPLYAIKKLKLSSFLAAQIVSNGFRFTYILAYYGTCLCVLSISVDRFLAAYLMTSYKVKMTMKRIKIYLIALWVYIFVLCSIPFINVSEEKQNCVIDMSNTTNLTCQVKRQFYYYQPQNEWVIFMLSVNCLLPYLIIVACYVYIMLKLKFIERVKDDKPMVTYGVKWQKDKDQLKIPNRKAPKTLSAEKKIKKYKEVMYLGLALAITYAIFWTPSILNHILLKTCSRCFPPGYDNSHTEQHVGFTIKYLAFLDSVASPLIYCFGHPEFRKAVIAMKRRKAVNIDRFPSVSTNPFE